MPPVRLRLLTSAIPTLISALTMWWALAVGNWSSWGISIVQPTEPGAASFADLKAILATAECMRAGTDYTICDPYGRPFSPYLELPARAIEWTGVGVDDAAWIGALLAVVYVATIAGLAWFLASSWRARATWLVAAQLLLGVLAISAPAMLAIERGQIEVIILALSVVALLALSRKGIGYGVLGAASGFLAVAGKYFAIGLWAPFIRRGRPHWAALVGLAVSVVFLALNLSAMSQASSASGTGVPTTSKSQFGAATLISTILTDDPVDYTPSAIVVENWTTIRIIGILVFGAAVVIAALLAPRAAVETLDRIPYARALLIGGVGVLAVPHVLGSSHDYRMVFLLPVIVGSLVWMSVSERSEMWLPGVVVLGATISMVTAVAMVPTPEGFIWGKAAMVVGDIALLITLAIGSGAWLRGLVRQPAQ